MDLLLHALGKVVDFLLGPFAQLEPLQPLPGAAVRFRLRQALQGPEKDQDLKDLHARVQASLFRQVTDPVGGVVVCGLPENFDPALVGNQDTHQHPQRGRLACAVWAEQAEHLAFGNRKAQLLDRRQHVETLGDSL